jgi:microcystin-dependent protein
MFLWDNQSETFGEQCFSLTSEREYLRLAGSILLNIAMRYPDLAHQMYLERPLFGFNEDIQAIITDVGLKLLNPDSDVIKDIRIEGCNLEKQLCDGTWESVGQVRQSLPIGMIFAAMAESMEGALLCNGTTYNIVDYPDLAAVLPEDFVFDPQFIVPYLNGRVPVGAFGGNSEIPELLLGAAGGEWKHSLTASENGPHSHSLHTDISFALVTQAYSPGLRNDAGRGDVDVPAWTTNSSGSGTPHNNAQPYFVVNWFIVAEADCSGGEGGIMSTFELRQNEDDDDLLEQTLDDGATWSLAYDFSKFRSKGTQTTLINNVINDNSIINNWITNNPNIEETIYPDAATETIDNQDFWHNALCFSTELFIVAIIEFINELHVSGAFDEQNVSKKAAAIAAAGGAAMAAASALFLAVPALGLAAYAVGLHFGVFGGTIIGVGMTLYATSGNEPPDLISWTQATINELICCITGYWLAEGEMSFPNFQQAILEGCTGLSAEAVELALLVTPYMQDKGMYVMFYSIFADAHKAAENGFALPACPCDAGCDEILMDWSVEGATPAGWVGALYVLGGGFHATETRSASQDWSHDNGESIWYQLRVTYTQVACIPTLVAGDFARATTNSYIFQIYARIGTTWTKVAQQDGGVGGSPAANVPVNLTWENPDGLTVDQIEFRCWTRDPRILMCRYE